MMPNSAYLATDIKLQATDDARATMLGAKDMAEHRYSLDMPL